MPEGDATPSAKADQKYLLVTASEEFQHVRRCSCKRPGLKRLLQGCAMWQAADDASTLPAPQDVEEKDLLGDSLVRPCIYISHR